METRRGFVCGAAVALSSLAGCSALGNSQSGTEPARETFSLCTVYLLNFDEVPHTFDFSIESNGDTLYEGEHAVPKRREPGTPEGTLLHPGEKTFDVSTLTIHSEFVNSPASVSAQLTAGMVAEQTGVDIRATEEGELEIWYSANGEFSPCDPPYSRNDTT